MRKCALLLAVCLLLTGCVSRQLEEELLVIALAVDVEETGVRLALKAPAAQEDKQYLQLEARGMTFAQAVTLLHASTPRKLNFSQVREILIGESAARGDGFPALLAQISALPHIRGAAVLVVCRGSACDTAAQLKPYLGIRLSRYTENTLADSAGKGFTPSTSLAQALRDLGGGLCDPLLIYGALNDPSAAGGAEDPLNRPPGDLPRKSGDPVDLFGAAATDGSRVTGFLSGDEMSLLHLLTGSGHVYAVCWEDLSAQLYARTPAELSVSLEGRPILLTVRLLCDVRMAPGSAMDESELRRRISQQIFALMARLQRLRCDALGFGGRAVRQFATIEKWESLDFPSLYRDARVQVDVTLRFLSDQSAESSVRAA